MSKESPLLMDEPFVPFLGGIGEQPGCACPWSLEVLIRQVPAASGCGSSESSCCLCPPGEFLAYWPVLVRLSPPHCKTLRTSPRLSKAQAQTDLSGAAPATFSTVLFFEHPTHLPSPFPACPAHTSSLPVRQEHPLHLHSSPSCVLCIWSLPLSRSPAGQVSMAQS